MSHYSCSSCAKKNVKLWRQTHVKNVQLKCSICLNCEDVDSEGKILSKTGLKTDCIGNFIPAVPIKGEDDGFWGYYSIPEADMKWWRSLLSK